MTIAVHDMHCICLSQLDVRNVFTLDHQTTTTLQPHGAVTSSSHSSQCYSYAVLLLRTTVFNVMKTMKLTAY